MSKQIMHVMIPIQAITYTEVCTCRLKYNDAKSDIIVIFKY